MSLIRLSEGNCRSCYKCINSCTVKAIRMVDEQAEVVSERCVNCGHCIVVCPQGARTIENKVSVIKEILNNKNRKVVASLAPSFAGAFDVDDYRQIVAGLKKIGFSIVEETAIGAEIVSMLYDDFFSKKYLENFITTSCPSVNYLIEKYYPSLIKYMAPIVSPMIAHGKLLKKNYGSDCFTVFIGPCVAKQAEASEEGYEGIIDAVINFGELKEWFIEEGIELTSLSPEEFDRDSPALGCEFPLLGGIVGNFKKIKKCDYDIIKVDGLKECMELFESIKRGDLSNVCIEANACRGGCIGGPAMEKQCGSYFNHLIKVKDYIKSKKISEKYDRIDIPVDLNFSTSFKDKSFTIEIASDEKITEILKQMGKYDKSDELNCGICGYDTCREKAQAVYEGMAEAENCLPHLRSKAERMTNEIFEYSPNIILIVDKHMKIKEINPTAESVFNTKSEYIKDKPVSSIIEDTDFISVMESGKNIFPKKKVYYKDKVILIDSIMYLHKYEVLLAIMRNITEQEKNREDFLDVKQNTLEAAQEVIEKQMRVAQEIASLLGETTAETKVILTKLKQIVLKEEDL